MPLMLKVSGSQEAPTIGPPGTTARALPAQVDHRRSAIGVADRLLLHCGEKSHDVGVEIVFVDCVAGVLRIADVGNRCVVG